jgi:hypothetical protein
LKADDRGPGDYGDTHAGVYDRIYGARFAPGPAVAALAGAAGPTGRLVELGVGAWRLAIPLVARRIDVDGIEASSTMIALLRSHPHGRRIVVFQVNLAEGAIDYVLYL